MSWVVLGFGVHFEVSSQLVNNMVLQLKSLLVKGWRKLEVAPIADSQEAGSGGTKGELYLNQS